MIQIFIDILGFLILGFIFIFFVLPSIVLFAGNELITVGIILIFMILLFLYFEIISYSPNQGNIIVMRNINSVFVIIGLFGTLISLAFSFYGLYNLIGGTQTEITSNLKNLLSQIRLVFIPSILGVYFTIWGTLKLTYIERRIFSLDYEFKNIDNLVSKLSKLEELENLKELSNLKKLANYLGNIDNLVSKLSKLEELENLKELSNLKELANYLEKFNSSIHEISTRIKEGIDKLHNLPEVITSEFKTIVDNLKVPLGEVVRNMSELSNKLDEMNKKLSLIFETLDDLNKKYQNLSETTKQTTTTMDKLNNEINNLLNFLERIANLKELLNELNVNLANINQFTTSLPSTIKEIYYTYIQTFMNIEDTIKNNLPSNLKSIENSFNNFKETFDEFNNKLAESIEELKEIRTLRESIESAVEEGLESGIRKYLGEHIKDLNEKLLFLANQINLLESTLKGNIGAVSQSAHEISKTMEELKPLVSSIMELVKTFDKPFLFRFAFGKRKDEGFKRNL